MVDVTVLAVVIEVKEVVEGFVDASNIVEVAVRVLQAAVEVEISRDRAACCTQWRG